MSATGPINHPTPWTDGRSATPLPTGHPYFLPCYDMAPSRREFTT